MLLSQNGTGHSRMVVRNIVGQWSVKWNLQTGPYDWYSHSLRQTYKKRTFARTVCIFATNTRNNGEELISTRDSIAWRLWYFTISSSRHALALRAAVNCAEETSEGRVYTYVCPRPAKYVCQPVAFQTAAPWKENSTLYERRFNFSATTFLPCLWRCSWWTLQERVSRVFPRRFKLVFPGHKRKELS